MQDPCKHLVDKRLHTKPKKCTIHECPPGSPEGTRNMSQFSFLLANSFSLIHLITSTGTSCRAFFSRRESTPSREMDETEKEGLLLPIRMFHPFLMWFGAVVSSIILIVILTDTGTQVIHGITHASININIFIGSRGEMVFVTTKRIVTIVHHDSRCCCHWCNADNVWEDWQRDWCTDFLDIHFHAGEAVMGCSQRPIAKKGVREALQNRDNITTPSNSSKSTCAWHPIYIH